MASPQKENGFTPIANELLEAIYGAAFTISELKIMLAVMRCTYGYSRKSHRISGSFLAKGCGLNKRSAARVLSGLIGKNCIRVFLPQSRKTSRELGIQKDYDLWKVSCPSGMYRSVHTPDSKKCTVQYTGYVPCSTPKVCTVQYTKVTKEKRKNKEMCIRPFSELFRIFWEAYPRRQAKLEALRAFINIAPDEAMLEAITDAVKKMTFSEEWRRDGGRYIPLPATYLRSRRWEDETTDVLRSGAGTGRVLLNETMKGIAK